MPELDPNTYCIVEGGGKLYKAEDFVAFMYNPTTGLSMFYQTDALTMGTVMQMAAEQFAVMLQDLTVEEAEMVNAVLTDLKEAKDE